MPVIIRLSKLLSSSLLSKNLKVRIYKTVILPVVLYGCETLILTLREEQRLRVLENKILRKIFGAKRDEVTGEWRKLHNTELHALYSLADIIRNIKSRRLRWAGHVARMGESRNAYRVNFPPQLLVPECQQRIWRSGYLSFRATGSATTRNGGPNCGIYNASAAGEWHNSSHTKLCISLVMGWLPLTVLLVCVALTHAQKDPNVVDGRSAIVHLFEWKFSDIADECERFLAPNGFAGVQVSPVHENLIVTSPNRPWWERYQLVSYNIYSRSGDEAAFRDMVRRCNNVGIRIYVDVVLNHMTGNWDNARGQAGDTADTYNLQYPAVPYGPGDFHSQCSITNYSDANNVRNCELNGLHDLNQGSTYVRGKMIEYLNNLVDSGIAGFRVDAAKHMWPADLEYIYSQVNDLSTDHGFASGTRPFIYQEVIDLGGEAIKSTEYTGFGRVTEFKYGAELGNAFRGNNPIKYLVNFGPGWGFLPDGDAFVFVDNHDNQRGHGAGGASILTYKTAKLYKMAVAFMLAYPYGYPESCPVSLSTLILTKAHLKTATATLCHPASTATEPAGTAGCASTGGGRSSTWWASGTSWQVTWRSRTSVNDWWDDGNQQIAFCRGGKGFIAFNDEFSSDLKQTLQTCLPAGTYCDIISGSKSNGSCTGKSVTVGSDGTGYIEILTSEDDGVLAIHADVSKMT
ncbi:hypothetical protein ANN_16470 [Periplaneta americana]|uniref:Alpha-amylase n=1 Tax=Periplaneta americana TaxID=6978 RepID=A0ABQ8SK72_PERAM|nr:hypothetical protein ANN_16470 [Periplaneta americana]